MAGATEFTTAGIVSRHVVPFFVICLAAVAATISEAAMAGEGDPPDAGRGAPDDEGEYQVMK